MAYLDNFKSGIFWIRVIKLALVFFFFFVLISLLISHFQNVVSGNWDAIAAEEWADGKWKNFLFIRVAISLVYSVYMVSRRTRSVDDK